jgi:hypothetical protein
MLLSTACERSESAYRWKASPREDAGFAAAAATVVASGFVP